MNQITITLPLYWQQSNSKTVLVGMSWYRNAHHFTQNKWKQEFQELVSEQVSNVKIASPYATKLNIYYKNPSCDSSNVAALMEKVVLDALQKLDITVNDNVQHHVTSTWSVAGQDKLNPRCEIVIYETKGNTNV